MTLLSNTDILRLRSTGAIVIDPFDPQALNNTSYDLTLGAEIARYRIPWDDYNDDPSTMFDLLVAGLRLGSETDGFYLKAGERVLGHSREVAGGRSVECAVCGNDTIKKHSCTACLGAGLVAVTTQLHATSTAARIGIQVCGCAGFGDVGFTSPWVYEITNMAPRSLWLPVGAVLAQVSFYQVTPPLHWTTYEKTGRYHHESRETWTLKDGLPKALKVRP